MGIRGEAFDFITTSPPAVIAKVIIWIGSENMATVKILYDIDEYLNSLDNIVMGDGSTQKTSREKMCEFPNYGHFVVVINKMMGDASDDELFRELMTKEPDYIPEAQERNEIRDKIYDCFNGISVHGLPVLNIESGQEIDYPILDERFKQGLGAMANVILEKSLDPRTVTVGGMALELNATTAEFIIETVIEESNKGKIDLTGFNSFWKLVLFQIEQEITATNGYLEISLPLCTLSKSVSCSECACSFRNDVIQETLEKIDAIFSFASQQAQDMFGEDVSNRVNEIYETEINPWLSENSCSSIRRDVIQKSDHCDFSEMSDNFVNPGNAVTISCVHAFVCGSMTFDATNISVSTENIYFSKDAEVVVLPPSKAANGKDGQSHGQSGEDGAEGVVGRDFFLHSQMLLKGSKTTFIFTSKGGEGGDGGKGFPGEPGADGANGKNGVDGVQGTTGKKGTDVTSISSEGDPADGPDVYIMNDKYEIEYRKTADEHHCCCQWHEVDWWRRYQYDKHVEVIGPLGGPGGAGTDGTNGENGQPGAKGGSGGNGGNGGNGGKSGSVFISGIDVTPVVNEIGGKGGVKGKGGAGGPGGIGGQGGKGGKGGLPGPGGAGGMGTSQERHFFCKFHHDERGDCGHLGFVGCGEESPREWADEYSTAHDEYKPCCQGGDGTAGPNGKNGVAGSNGQPGATGNQGSDGINGIDA